MFRNPEAHQPKIEWPVSEQDALEILSLISRIIIKPTDRACRCDISMPLKYGCKKKQSNEFTYIESLPFVGCGLSSCQRPACIIQTFTEQLVYFFLIA